VLRGLYGFDRKYARRGLYGGVNDRIHRVFTTPIPSRDRALIALRTVVEVAAAYFFISALFHMPIANVTAILQALPLTVTLAGAVFLGGLGTQWQPLSGLAAMQLAGAAFFVIGGYVFSVNAMRSGEIGFVAPFRYTSLVVALVLGLAFFGEWPDGFTLTGCVIVVATGLFTLYRERTVAGTSARTTPTAPDTPA